MPVTYGCGAYGGSPSYSDPGPGDDEEEEEQTLKKTQIVISGNETVALLVFSGIVLFGLIGFIVCVAFFLALFHFLSCDDIKGPFLF